LVVTRWQQYSTHLNTNSTQNDTKIVEECGPCPVLESYTLAFALQLRNNRGKSSVRVAEECQLALKSSSSHPRVSVGTTKYQLALKSASWHPKSASWHYKVPVCTTKCQLALKSASWHWRVPVGTTKCQLALKSASWHPKRASLH